MGSSDSRREVVSRDVRRDVLKEEESRKRWIKTKVSNRRGVSVSASSEAHPADQLLLNVDSELEGSPSSRLSWRGDLSVVDAANKRERERRSQ